MERLEMRFHSRGNHGMVTAARIMAEAAHGAGMFATLTPRFGAAKAGEPLAVDLRIGLAPIEVAYPIIIPGIVVVSDETLLPRGETCAGMNEHTVFLVNSHENPETLARHVGAGHVCVVDATEIGRHELGHPYPNAALLGLLSRVVHAKIGLSSIPVAQMLYEHFGGEPNGPAMKNLRAFERGHDEFRSWDHEGGGVHLQVLAAPKLPSWRAMADGATLPALLEHYRPTTGAWRTGQVPVLDKERCEHCLLCWPACPDRAIIVKGEKLSHIDLDACKGCGICAKVCPPKFNAISIQEEH